mgnify:CR=1 FL=1
MNGKIALQSLRALLLSCLAFSFSACGLFKKKAEPIEIERSNIGTIDSVHGSDFVLVRLNGTLKPPGGATLISEGQEGSANLQLTGEKVGPFVAADIRSGTPLKNDPVFLYLNFSKDEEETEEGGLTYPGDETSENQEAAGSHAESALPKRSNAP